MNTQTRSAFWDAHLRALAPNEQPPKMGVTLLFVTFVGRVSADEINGLISVAQTHHVVASHEDPNV
jgi:hypothetical protein